jgi:phosphatidylglycerophosphatase A
MKTFYRVLATLGPIGYIKGGGTLATIVTVPLAYWFMALHSEPQLQLLTLALTCGAALVVIKRASTSFAGHDPREIVVDEVAGAGCMVTFYGIAPDAWSLALGFVLFRIFDIYKPLGIKRLEQLATPWGILADDLAAALLSNVIVRGLHYLTF